MESQNTISLGFTSQKLPRGSHVCQIFSRDDERQESLLKFILSGLNSNDRTSCFSDKTDLNAVEEFLSNYGISYSEAEKAGAFALAGTTEVYYKENRFDPERMLKILSGYYEDSKAMGFSGARIIGEMTPQVQDIPGGNRLLEYEARVSLLLREHPVTAVCQYDSRSFDGSVIMDILKVHPLMVLRGSIVHNPFFVEPEDFLSKNNDFGRE